MGKGDSGWSTEDMFMADTIDGGHRGSGCGCLFFLLVMGAASVIPAAAIITGILFS